MTFNFMIAPDFAPERFAGWHMLNTVLQKRSGQNWHLLTPVGPSEQTSLLSSGVVDMVYANPFDASDMIRSHGFIPFARPIKHSDEMVIATGADSGLQKIEDIKPGMKIAVTDNKDVKLIGLRLLEPADLVETAVEWIQCESFQAAARLVMKGEVQAGFFLAEAYASFTRMTKSQLRTLVESRISDITHVILANPRITAEIPKISETLTGVGKIGSDQEVLQALGLPNGFETVSQEDAEFMIDLMDTLLD